MRNMTTPAVYLVMPYPNCIHNNIKKKSKYTVYNVYEVLHENCIAPGTCVRPSIVNTTF